ncbi:hypothetical protein F5Y06DRAFT_72964 [Hypoxylon sp. FL0890]|nr:hypothetical protein F5Y06DRAFT_72964 [Hypoxylon sp. FL0890]
MSTSGKTRLLETSEGLTSDDEEAIKTHSTDGESLFDFLPFEDIVAPSIDNVENTCRPKDVILPVTLGSSIPNLSRLNNLPGAHQIIDWIMGRKLIVQEEPGSGEWLYGATKTSKTSTQDVGVGQFGGQVLVDHDFVDIGDVQDICPACTTPYCQAIDSLPFKSSLRLSYNDAETHTWFIGDKYVMTESVDDESSDETDVNLVLATDLLRESTRVPVPNLIAGWKENGKVITITERAPGQRLYDIWWDLKDNQKEGIAREVAHCVDRWRRLPADRVSSLGGGPVWHHDHLIGTVPEGFGPFGSDEQMWNAINCRLRKKNVNKDVIQTLKDYMPESAPVLTHGDLSCTNIVIHHGAVSAILGFNNAACLPAWAEHVAVHFCYTKEDEQWKAMLSRHIKNYPWAKDWWSLWMAAENHGSDKRRIASLLSRCRRWQKPPERKRLSYSDVSAEEREKVHENRSYQGRDLGSEPQSQLRSPRRNGFQVRKMRSPFRTALSRKLLKGRHYSELLRDPHWELVLRSPTEESDVAEVNEVLALIEKRMEVERTPIKKSLGVPEEESRGDEIPENRRISIERWLSESERGRKTLRPLFTQHVPGEKAATPPYRSPVKSPPWRERQRSFERPDNTSKGLRPLSLPHTHQSESVRHNLQEIEQNKDRSDDDDSSSTHERLREEALRSLEAGWENTPAVATAALWPDNEYTGQRSGTEGKRTSIFREKTAPGSLYLAVANAGAEGRNRRHRRSRSEERAPIVEGGEPTHQQRPRPQSLMPQLGEG